jgi:hypothetical protein
MSSRNVRDLNFDFSSTEQLNNNLTTLAMNFPGGGSGISPLGARGQSTVGMDAQQLQEQQMIQTVRKNRLSLPIYAETNTLPDASSDGIMSRKNSNGRSDGLRTRWCLWSLHVFGTRHPLS